MKKQKEDFLPLSQATYYILLSLREVRHGYAIMKTSKKSAMGTLLWDQALYMELSVNS